jgi:IS30 family transposase
MKIRENQELEKSIKEQLLSGWMPDEIAGRLKLENNGKSVINFKSIYKWLDTVYGIRYKGYLPSKQAGWRRRKKSRKTIIKNRIGIEQRLEIINQRMRLGDFEGYILGSPKSELDRLASIVDRSSRYADLKKMKRLKEAVPTFKTMLEDNNGLSCNLDNGPENASHQKICLPVFFCRPYAAWEKGTIENTFQRLRRYISRGSKISSFSNEQISAIVDKMDNTPRRF